MSVFDELRQLLTSGHFTQLEFQNFCSNSAVMNKRRAHIGLQFILSKLESEFDKYDVLTAEEIESNPTLVNFLEETPLPIKTAKKKPKPTPKKKIPQHLRSSKKRINRLSKSEKRSLDIAKGIVKKTKNQLKAEKENKERQNQLNSNQTTTKSSIWTVRKK